MFAFHDLNLATAKAHLLICTKEHIESALHVSSEDILFKMQEFGKEVLQQLYRIRY